MNGWLWGGGCCAVAAGAITVVAAAFWWVRARAGQTAPLRVDPSVAIDVALMQSLAHMLVEAEAAAPDSERGVLARETEQLAAENRREELLDRLARWESLGGAPKDKKAFNDMKRALR